MTEDAREETPRPEPRLATVLRTSVHAIAGAVFAWPLTQRPGVLGAALGAGLGAWLGVRLARSRLRTPALVALVVAVGAGLLALTRWVTLDTSLLAGRLGPASALRVSDALQFFELLATISASVRLTTVRHRAFAVLEVAGVGLAFAQLVVAHRHGAINRPFELADPILSTGGDPTTVFMGLGAVATAVVVLLLMSEERSWRALLHLGAAALLLALFLRVSGAMEMPEPPPPANGLGLRPDEGEGDRKPNDEEESQANGGGGGGGRKDQDELEFRDDQDTSNERVPVAVVLFHDDYSPPYGVYYFRQGAFSQYNGRRLVSAVGAGVDRDIARDFPTVVYDVPDAPPVNANRTTVETTVALLADHTRPFGLEAPIRFAPSPNPDPDRFRRTYRVTSAVLTADFRSMVGSRAGSASWTPEQWSHYLQAPTDPRYAELTERVLRERLSGSGLEDDPAAKVAAITGWLSQEGKYSLRSRHAGAEDPTADFLFGDLTGYCVHFAHAAAYMLRAAGLPARVATGYAIDEATRQGGSALLVSGEASHAWAEVYFEGFGWVVADVSPQTVLTPPGPPPDPELQRLLGELARGLRTVPPGQPADECEGGEPRLPVPPWVLALLLIAAALVGLQLVKLWRRWAPRFASPEAQPRVAYRAALDRLSEVRLRRERGESREAFAARVGDQVPSFVALTRVHVGAAFGSRRSKQEAARLPRALDALDAELARSVPPGRRWLGRLKPWSWLTSR